MIVRSNALSGCVRDPVVSFHRAECTLEGSEAINMMEKGQVKRLAGSAGQGQAKFVASLFQSRMNKESPVTFCALK